MSAETAKKLAAAISMIDDRHILAAATPPVKSVKTRIMETTAPPAKSCTGRNTVTTTPSVKSCTGRNTVTTTPSVKSYTGRDTAVLCAVSICMFIAVIMGVPEVFALIQPTTPTAEESTQSDEHTNTDILYQVQVGQHTTFFTDSESTATVTEDNLGSYVGIVSAPENVNFPGADIYWYCADGVEDRNRIVLRTKENQLLVFRGEYEDHNLTTYEAKTFEEHVALMGINLSHVYAIEVSDFFDGHETLFSTEEPSIIDEVLSIMIPLETHLASDYCQKQVELCRQSLGMRLLIREELAVHESSGKTLDLSEVRFADELQRKQAHEYLYEGKCRITLKHTDGPDYTFTYIPVCQTVELAESGGHYYFLDEERGARFEELINP